MDATGGADTPVEFVSLLGYVYNRLPMSEDLVRIALNAQLLNLDTSYRSAGISNYIYGLLRHLPAQDGHFQYYVHTGEAAAVIPGMQRFLTTSHTKRPLARIMWEQIVWPLALQRLQPDLVHGLAYVLPLAYGGTSIVTVYDLTFLHVPMAFRAPNRLYLQTMTRIAVRRAAHVCAISESTRRDIVKMLGVSASAVSIVYPGVDARFRPASPEAVEAFRRRQGLPERYLLYLGTLEPRKNITTLVRAYARLAARDPRAPSLVLAGAKGWYYEEIFAEVERLGLKDRVIFPGYVPVEEQALWYSGAEAFVYPSRYEGFGMPVAEAMACGTPVIASTASSLPEVVGDAGLLVPPDDEDAWADALAHVLANNSVRDALSAAGRKQAARFSWEAAAQAQVRVYRQYARR